MHRLTTLSQGLWHLRYYCHYSSHDFPFLLCATTMLFHKDRAEATQRVGDRERHTAHSRDILSKNSALSGVDRAAYKVTGLNVTTNNEITRVLTRNITILLL